MANKMQTNIVSRLTVTRYSDRPAHLHCTGDMAETARMLAMGLEILAGIIKEKKDEQAPQPAPLAPPVGQGRCARLSGR